MPPDHLFCLYHVNLLILCDYGSECQSHAHDLNNHSSNSPSMHSEMISPFYPDSGTTSCSLICFILTLRLLKNLKAPGISSHKVTGCSLLPFMQVCSHLNILMTAELHQTGLLKTLIKLATMLNTIALLFFQLQNKVITGLIQYPNSESIQARCWRLNDEVFLKLRD